MVNCATSALQMRNEPWNL